MIALQGEYDALPQKKVPYKDPIVEGASGHGCGHNLYGASGVGGAIATKVAMEAAELKGTVKFLGTTSSLLASEPRNLDWGRHRAENHGAGTQVDHG